MFICSVVRFPTGHYQCCIVKTNSVETKTKTSK